MPPCRHNRQAEACISRDKNPRRSIVKQKAAHPVFDKPALVRNVAGYRPDLQFEHGQRAVQPEPGFRNHDPDRPKCASRNQRLPASAQPMKLPATIKGRPPAIKTATQKCSARTASAKRGISKWFAMARRQSEYCSEIETLDSLRNARFEGSPRHYRSPLRRGIRCNEIVCRRCRSPRMFIVFHLIFS